MNHSTITFLLLLLLPNFIQSFTSPLHHRLRNPTHLFSSSSSSSSINTNVVDIVLFGPGDLRTTDHAGLTNACTSSSPNNKILPLVILSNDSLSNLPGAKSHTLDTSVMLTSSLQNLETRLDDLGLVLHFQTGETFEDALDEIIQETKGFVDDSRINIHVCDLGNADTDMKYAPHGLVKDSKEYEIIPWKCPLRNEPWNEITSPTFPTGFPDYQRMFASSKILKPLEVPQPVKEGVSLTLPSRTPVSDSSTMTLLLCTALQKNNTHLQSEAGTGLWGTHWGRLNDSICTEDDTLAMLRVWKECSYNQESFQRHPSFLVKKFRNPNSLEHASLEWMSAKESNLIEGELLLRYLAAPLFWGCVSCRQVWHAQTEDTGNWVSKSNVLRDAAEGREWHVLFAAHSIVSSSLKNEDELRYKYWRWHGFLCRYGLQHFSNNDESTTRGLVLLHGFGASGSQWSKTLTEISKQQQQSKLQMGFVPDLIGFGHAEKPSLTYTQYLWESYSSDFINDVCLNRVDEFVLGGNSIGGYTSMATAADDCVRGDGGGNVVSASGAKGSGKCRGLILMNSAGRILKEEEVEKEGDVSVAVRTIGDLLGECSPPARPLAKLFGNTLLWYLRPRIQSICTNLYPANPSAVDIILTTGILRDSLDPGAINVMISGSKLPPPRTANELLGANRGCGKKGEATWEGPVLVVQGMKDPLNDAVGRAEGLGMLREGIVVRGLGEGGHCPHDELPVEVAREICVWLEDGWVEGVEAKDVVRGVELKV